ncbi:NAD-dependent epimerase [Candidatus Peregrinibacteria bacterium CG22_combo_CG10-13_8_21_14_all_49_11]|nr:MAG: NAD-dependent epimerase [Candidatus Peregrinibacteria bacterium CG22_combo_CG10-13_8_21_14_all_49_11]
MAENHVALVVGSSGIIGNALVEELSERPDWEVHALRRTTVPNVTVIDADLHDATATKKTLKAVKDTTHVFYAALAPRADLYEEEQVNAMMLQNLLEGLTAHKTPLQRVILYQGAKVYGVHLGAAHAPFYEDAPRHLGPNFYYAQEDLLQKHAQRHGYDWSILRPDVVVGSIAGNPMNIAVIIGVFAALSKAAGIPLRFPGALDTYREFFAQTTDARWLARASLWAAHSLSAKNEAFNIVGDPFHWEHMWNHIADVLGMEVAEPQPLSLARHMPSHASAWEKLTKKPQLEHIPFEQIVHWGFGDFVFHAAFDVISDMNKIRRAGFLEPADTKASFTRALTELKEKKILPS